LLYCGLLITTTNIIINRVYTYNDKFSEIEEKEHLKNVTFSPEYFEEHGLKLPFDEIIEEFGY